MWAMIARGLSWLIHKLTILLAGIASQLFGAFGNQFRLLMQGWLVKVFSIFFIFAISSIIMRLVAAVFCLFFLSPDKIIAIVMHVGGVSLDAGCAQLPPEVCPILAYAGFNDFVNQSLNTFWRIGWFLYIMRGLKKLWVF